MSDRGDYYSEHVVTGRKAYVCNFCRRALPVGARHVTISASQMGRRWNKRVHLECHNAVVERAPLAVVEAGQ